jgi:23S rRNA (guanine745-N1)-methyltransferase
MPTLLCTVRDCRAPLAREEHRAVCTHGHSFDVARSGYLNLLQPQDRRSREPGDSAEAVAARRRLLDAGTTKPIDDAIARLVRGETILDAGCGEGHILGRLARGCGIDISVPAIEAAARRHPDREWIVANADRFIPYDNASFDVVLSITARLNAVEFRRVVRDDGMLLVAIAGPDDLVELRGHSRDRVERTVEMFGAQFALAQHERIAFTIGVDADTLRDLAVSTYRPKRMKEVPRITMSRDLLLFRPS